MWASDVSHHAVTPRTFAHGLNRQGLYIQTFQFQVRGHERFKHVHVIKTCITIAQLFLFPNAFFLSASTTALTTKLATFAQKIIDDILKKIPQNINSLFTQSHSHYSRHCRHTLTSSCFTFKCSAHTAGLTESRFSKLRGVNILYLRSHLFLRFFVLIHVYCLLLNRFRICISLDLAYRGLPSNVFRILLSLLSLTRVVCMRRKW